MREAVVVINPGQAWPPQKVLLQHLVPHLLDGLDLGIKAMTADVNVVTFELFGPGNPTYGSTLFENNGFQVSLGQLVSGGQASRPGPDDHDIGFERPAGGRCIYGH